MLKNKFLKNGIKPADGTSVVANRINEDCCLEGNINSKSDIRVDGNIKGNVCSASKIVIGNTGKVEGDIKSKDLTVEGIVNGNIDVCGTLYLRKSAQIGPYQVTFSKIIIEEGVEVKCRLMPRSVNNQIDIQNDGEKESAQEVSDLD
ncbi:MAG: polymer-forming cytoskeletal protein [Chitinophagales bacterium]|nr:polymer-forming cytoskeletal protein [Chitinophagales bacterium]